MRPGMVVLLAASACVGRGGFEAAASDDDEALSGLPTVAWETATSTVSEGCGAGCAIAPLTLSEAADADIVVSLTASGASASAVGLGGGSLLVPRGVTRIGVAIAVADDDLLADRLATITLGVASGARLGTLVAHEVTIRDDDGPTVDLDLRAGQRDGLVFTRASAAYVTDSDGYLRLAAIDEPRFAFDPISGDGVGLLIEESSTNLSVDASEDLTSGFNVTRVANQGLFATGEMTMDRFTVTAVNDFHHIYDDGVGAVGSQANVAHTVSLYLGVDQHPYVIVKIAEAADATQHASAVFDLVTRGVFPFTSGAGVVVGVPAVHDVGHGLRRIEVSGIANQGSVAVGRIRVSVSFGVGPADLTLAFPGAGQTLLAGGLQIERGKHASSYIRTGPGLAPTRAADVVTFAPQLTRPTHGTYVVGLDLVRDTTAMLLSVDSSVPSTGHELIYAQSLLGARSFADNGDSVSTLDAPLGTVVQAHRASYHYGDASFALSVDGGLSQVTTTGAPSAASVTRLGSDASGARYVNGHLSAVSYYPARLDDAQARHASTVWRILGVTGPEDTTTDRNLVGQALPVFHVEPAPRASAYEFHVFDGTTEVCVTTTETNATSEPGVSLPGDCVLSTASRYWVRAYALDGSTRTPAANNEWSFGTDPNP